MFNRNPRGHICDHLFEKHKWATCLWFDIHYLKFRHRTIKWFHKHEWENFLFVPHQKKLIQHSLWSQYYTFYLLWQFYLNCEYFIFFIYLIFSSVEISGFQNKFKLFDFKIIKCNNVFMIKIKILIINVNINLWICINISRLKASHNLSSSPPLHRTGLTSQIVALLFTSHFYYY